MFTLGEMCLGAVFTEGLVDYLVNMGYRKGDDLPAAAKHFEQLGHLERLYSGNTVYYLAERGRMLAETRDDPVGTGEVMAELRDGLVFAHALAGESKSYLKLITPRTFVATLTLLLTTPSADDAFILNLIRDTPPPYASQSQKDILVAVVRHGSPHVVSRTLQWYVAQRSLRWQLFAIASGRSEEILTIVLLRLGKRSSTLEGATTLTDALRECATDWMDCDWHTSIRCAAKHSTAFAEVLIAASAGIAGIEGIEGIADVHSYAARGAVQGGRYAAFVHFAGFMDTNTLDQYQVDELVAAACATDWVDVIRHLYQQLKCIMTESHLSIAHRADAHVCFAYLLEELCPRNTCSNRTFGQWLSKSISSKIWTRMFELGWRPLPAQLNTMFRHAATASLGDAASRISNICHVLRTQFMWDEWDSLNSGNSRIEKILECGGLASLTTLQGMGLLLKARSISPRAAARFDPDLVMRLIQLGVLGCRDADIHEGLGGGVERLSPTQLPSLPLLVRRGHISGHCAKRVSLKEVYTNMQDYLMNAKMLRDIRRAVEVCCQLPVQTPQPSPHPLPITV